MFHDIPQPMLDRMKELEQIDARDRVDGTIERKRLLQVPPETGKFIALLAAAAPAGRYIQIGTSAGYSAMWLSLACRLVGRTLTTFEILEEKIQLARQTFEMTCIGDVVNSVHGNALDYLPDCHDVSFCFLDGGHSTYAECYEIVVPNLVPGGFFVADNVISHEKRFRPMLERVMADDRVDALIVPIGKGELVCRKN